MEAKMEKKVENSMKRTSKSLRSKVMLLQETMMKTRTMGMKKMAKKTFNTEMRMKMTTVRRMQRLLERGLLEETQIVIVMRKTKLPRKERSEK